MRRAGWTLIAGLLLALWAWSQYAVRPAPDGSDMLPEASQPPDSAPAPRTGALPGYLPAEARQTLRNITQGGPFPQRQDGGVFQNRERLLPARPRGYYREYTVSTPGSRDRGARRLVSGGDPPVEYFYTDDHYRSFRRFDPPPETPR